MRPRPHVVPDYCTVYDSGARVRLGKITSEPLNILCRYPELQKDTEDVIPHDEKNLSRLISNTP